MSRTIPRALALLLALAVFQTIWAFKPTNSRRATPNDQTHQSITEAAITELDQQFFSVTTLTSAMKKALQNIVDANASVDLGTSFFSEQYHFDDESFMAGQALILAEFNDIINALQSKDTKAARQRLGQALHTLQDFYSHSSWAEANATANPNLGVVGQAIQNVAGATEQTCTNCTPCVNCTTNISTTHLTSGYFSINPFFSKPTGKCSHGGPGDTTSSSPATGGINKDTLDCNTSPHGVQYHTKAAGFAKDTTKQFILALKAKITPSQLKLLLGAGPTLTISIDTTGSMGDIIESVKNQAIQIVNDRLGTDQEPSKYVLAPFNDPNVPDAIITDDPNEFKTAISSLFASGGGDCPELSMTGMFKGVSASDDGGELFMFTDASSKDAGLEGDVEALALNKDIHIFPFVFGSCSPIDPAYVRLANNTGGQIFVLARTEAAKITNLADLTVRSNAVTILNVNDVVMGSKSYTIPADSTLTSLTFSVSGTSNMTIKRPDGTVVASADSGVTAVTVSTGTILSIKNPPSGIWGITLNASGSISLLVSGESPLSLTSFRFVMVGGRAGHDGLFPIEGAPLAGQISTADAVLAGPFTNAAFDLRTSTGALVQSLALTRDTGVGADEFTGDIVVPKTPFLPYATGTDSAGKAFQRIIPGLIVPTSVQVVPPLAQDLHPGQTTTYTFQVSNLGSSETFTIMASDDKGYLQTFGPTTLSLTAGQTGTVTVQLQPPMTNVQPATTDTLTVSAQGTVSGARNFAVVTSIVILNRPPDVGNAHASVAVLWPPNHGLNTVSILGVTDPDNDPVTIRIDRIMQDEPTNGLGDGDTCPDGSGVGGPAALLRAERAGTGNGRVYTIFFTASDGRGGSTPGIVRVSVPHDQAHDAVDDGANFDSSTCTP